MGFWFSLSSLSNALSLYLELTYLLHLVRKQVPGLMPSRLQLIFALAQPFVSHTLAIYVELQLSQSSLKVSGHLHCNAAVNNIFHRALSSANISLNRPKGSNLTELQMTKCWCGMPPALAPLPLLTSPQGFSSSFC